MVNQQYPSRLLENAVSQLARLPGVGRKTALRLALHLLRQDEEATGQLTAALTALRRDVQRCRVCHNISDREVCPVCADSRRDRSMICVVENVQDVMAVENTQQYHGLYHVLGGVISPMDGIGPGDLEIQSLVDRIEDGEAQEVILALSPTMEGDTTNFYIFRKLAPYTDLKVTVIARGVAMGDELEYADEVTLGRSILNRTIFEAK